MGRSSCRVKATGPSLLRAKDGSAFARCEECNKDVPVALISMHSCSLDAKIKMNLASQVVEQPSEAKKKPAERKKATSEEPKPKRLRKEKEKKGKDSNKTKRTPTAFFLFMDDFRKSYKEANPDIKGVKEVAKEGGEKWRSMTDEEKKPYIDKAAELKAKASDSNSADIGDDEGASEKEDNEKDDDGKKGDDKEDNENEEVLDDY